jgi:hypothetical protein
VPEVRPAKVARSVTEGMLAWRALQRAVPEVQRLGSGWDEVVMTNLELAHQFIASMLCGDDEVSKAAHTAGKHYIRDFALWLDQRADEPSADARVQTADECFQAAYAEGWIDALANGDIERIRDLWERRISFAQLALSGAYSSSKPR